MVICYFLLVENKNVLVLRSINRKLFDLLRVKQQLGFLFLLLTTPV